jgi:ZIP family zinc transporter
MLSPVVMGFLASLFSGGATALGALPVLIMKKRPKHELVDFLLSIAAGVMIAASAFSLIIPAYEEATITWNNWGLWLVILGISIGGMLVFGTDKLLEKFSPKYLTYGDTITAEKSHRGVLIASAIIIHNIPEGLAVGVAFSIAGGEKIGIVLAIAIGLQNMPEGLAVAIPFLEGGMPKWKVFLIALGSGIVEPIAALIGGLLVGVFNSIIPVALAIAAGAMVYIVMVELIPETLSHGNKYIASLGIFIGFLILIIMQYSPIFG